MKSPFRVWLHSLLATVIGGAASSVSAMVVAPEVFNLCDLGKLGKLAFSAALVNLVFFLRKSPLPEATPIPQGGYQVT